MLAERWSWSFPSVISNTQSAFVSGWLLVENVLMATKLVREYNWKNISKRCMLKVDLKKAFDSVNWFFIILILRNLGFPSSFLNLIHQCISTTQFSVTINDELCGYLKDTRGLHGFSISLPICPCYGSFLTNAKQGVCLRSYRLSSICFKPFGLASCLWRWRHDLLWWTLCLPPKYLSHSRAIFYLVWALHEPKQNWALFCWTNHDETIELTDLVSLSVHFRLDTWVYPYAQEAKDLRLQTTPWLTQIAIDFLVLDSSIFCGRRQLISSVIYGTLNFWLSRFILPKGCIKHVESLWCRFLWYGNITSRAAARISWENFCLPRSEGGFGLRDVQLWNKTLLLKLIWLLHDENVSLWIYGVSNIGYKRRVSGALRNLRKDLRSGNLFSNFVVSISGSWGVKSGMA